MKKFLIATALALLLTGCAGLNVPVSANNPVGVQQLAAIEQSYKVALRPAVAYIELPTCRKSQSATLTNPCGDYATKLKLQDAIRKARTARLALSKFVRQNPTLDASSYASALQQAISLVNQLSTGG